MQNPIDTYKQKPKKGKRRLFFFSAIVIAGAGLVFGLNSGASPFFSQQASPQNTENKYIKFTAEAYKKIKNNYWKKMEDEQLATLFKKGISKLSENPASLPSKDLEGVKEELSSHLQGKSEEARHKYVTDLTRLVLKSLPPQGRNKLYGKKEKKNLANRVNNVNPSSNLYGKLGLNKGASKQKVQQKAQKKKEEIQKQIQQAQQKVENAETKEEEQKARQEKKKAKEQLREIKYSKEVLTDKKSKEHYDTTGAEPTVFKKRLSPDIVHIYIEKFSPTTLKELKNAVDSVDMSRTKPSSLILDLRENVGGSIDIAPYILGPFIGKGHTAYKTYQQDHKEPVKTKTGWMNGLVPYKKVVVLANEKTQSTGEVFVSALKKYNVGVVVGKTTRGWGTIEKVFKMDTSISPRSEYGLFLVHHLTLRADGKPIQGRGVNPDVSITSKNWKDKLNKYFNAPKLIEKVEEVWNSKIPAKQ